MFIARIVVFWASHTKLVLIQFQCSVSAGIKVSSIVETAGIKVSSIVETAGIKVSSIVENGHLQWVCIIMHGQFSSVIQSCFQTLSCIHIVPNCSQLSGLLSYLSILPVWTLSWWFSASFYMYYSLSCKQQFPIFEMLSL